ncbi:NUMOD4 domain-containing protein [Chryseobacterium hagamense]|uniref:NUMOD4 domain-containing protein n=1 Tax=Chryseobacterium hagamense TaxID=395935 RepID=A0A511YRN4_9FLAO|nr:NUMOD4 domain-containing protein [Chryseobacterium hagamense]GEN77851.1 hypothetical protein CHA01nite_35910 [Chryseobacterium hagamense]
MMLPPEIEDQYVREVLYNTSLRDLPDEKWKLIDEFENYAISNYGRVKSLARLTLSFQGNFREQEDLIMKLIFNKNFNRHANRSFYNVFCSLTLDNKRYRKSISRLVYYHFVEKFDLSDRNFIISYKDGNSLNTNYKNLEKITCREKVFKSIKNKRADDPQLKYQESVSQYTVKGEWIANFDSIIRAEETLGIKCTHIFHTIERKTLTAGGFRWFAQSSPPKKEDFIIITKSSPAEKIFNKRLWERLGKPRIDKKNPPPCMNLTLQDLPGEYWKPVPRFEDLYRISNKGRVKRLGEWNSNKKAFRKEHIMSIMAEIKNSGTYYLYLAPYVNGKIKNITISRVLYYCFVQEFDLNDRTLAVINQNDPSWDMNPSKLLLRSIYSDLKEK